jgi:hypothetical protein
LGLTDGRTIERDLNGNLRGPVFQPLQDPAFFAQVRVDYGTVVWPNGVDLDPDVLIWGDGGAPLTETGHGSQTTGDTVCPPTRT